MFFRLNPLNFPPSLGGESLRGKNFRLSNMNSLSTRQFWFQSIKQFSWQTIIIHQFERLTQPDGAFNPAFKLFQSELLSDLTGWEGKLLKCFVFWVYHERKKGYWGISYGCGSVFGVETCQDSVNLNLRYFYIKRFVFWESLRGFMGNWKAFLWLKGRWRYERVFEWCLKGWNLKLFYRNCEKSMNE